MKKLRLLPLAALLLAACSEAPTSPNAQHPDAAQLANGVSNPNTTVSAEFTIAIGGSVVYRASGPGNNGKGTCTSGTLGAGYWYNPQNKKTSDKPHPQCASIEGGEEITVTFKELANYVLATSGNVQLNFSVDPELGTSRGIQYKKNGDNTIGFGVLSHTGDSADATRVWTIDLGQDWLNGSGNRIIPEGTLLEACNVDIGCHPGMMTW